MRCCLYLKCSLSRLSVDYNCCQFCRKRNNKQIFEFLCSLELKTIGLQESSLNHPATPLYIHSWTLDVMAHWLRRLLSTGRSWVRLPLWPSRRDLGQVLYLQLPVRFGVKLRYSNRAVIGSASE